ncbi:MAG: hypothetical protein ACLQPD_23020 [Desulfomonilaceae bacterium]
MNLVFDLQKDKSLRENNPLSLNKIVSLWDVLNFYAEKFARISSLMGGISMAPFGNQNDRIRLSRPLLDQLTWLHSIADELKLKGVLANVDRFLRDVRSRSATNVQVKRSAQALNQSIVDEFKGELILAVMPAQAEYYEMKGTFLGKKLVDRLSHVEGVTEEADEAGNCYALERYTACVFHLMRLMEYCLQKLGGMLGLGLTASYDKEWQKIINDIRGALKLKYPKDKDPMRIKYEAMLGHLETVKIAWRNPTMHPKATYTRKEAEKIIGAVQAFVEGFSLLTI